MEEWHPDKPANPAPTPQQKTNKTLLYVGIGCGTLVLLGLIAGGLFTWWAASKAVEFAENPAYGTLRLAVAANPDLETVKADDATGTITVRDKRTGKVETLTIDSMQDGKLVIAGEGGSMVMGGGANGEGELVITGKNGERLVAKGGPGGGSLVVTDENGAVTAQAEALPGGQVRIDQPGEGDSPPTTIVTGGGAGAKLPEWVPAYPGATAKEGASLVTTSGDTTSGTFGFLTTDPASKVFATYGELLTKAGLAIKTKIESGDGGLMVAASADGKRQLTVTIGKDESGTMLGLTFQAQP